jgi:putative ABC transport system substrate-binding protein
MQFSQLERREFIAVIGGAAAWPLAARAQQLERLRRIGLLTPWSSNDAEAQDRVKAFVQTLQRLGWIDGQNLHIDYRWGDDKADTTRKYAAELVALAPDVILALSSSAVAPLLDASRTFPSYSRVSQIRLRPAMSRAWHGRVVTLRALPFTNIPSVGNGSSC